LKPAINNPDFQSSARELLVVMQKHVDKTRTLV